jgi:hypothetical protein
VLDLADYHGHEDHLRALVRAHQAHFPVAWALGSYVLHFMGKSTWRGAETPQQRQQREQTYLAAFQAKWGEALLEALVLGRTERLIALPGVAEALVGGDFRGVVAGALRQEAESARALSPRAGH